jgi:hypothetical protein
MGSQVWIQRHGWRLAIADDLARADEVIEAALELAGNTSLLLRRSRHASTFLLRSPTGTPDMDLFVKHFDPPVGWDRMKSWYRRSRLSRTMRVTAAMRAAGFTVPPVLLHGMHRQSRRELIVTARAEGDGPLLALQALGGSITAKRAILHALGEEVARLHLAGFIHGDLTPFNIRITIDEPPRFAFIDNDRTRSNVIIGHGRQRMRNLVQLGRLVLPGITRTDRMRLFRAYEAIFHRRHSRSMERKVVAMLRRRAERALKR